MERYELMERMLDKKCNVADAVKLEPRLTKFESKVWEAEQKHNNHMVELEARITHMEMKITTNIAAANDNMDHDNGPSDEELIKVVVQEELNRKTAEEKDIDNRKKNIILYRVPETRSDSSREESNERRHNPSFFDVFT